MTDSMKKQAAEALLADIKRQFGGGPIPGDASPDSWTAGGGTLDCEELAKAAIEALKLPTDAMVDAAWGATPAPHIRAGKYHYRLSITAAMEAALEENN